MDDGRPGSDRDPAIDISPEKFRAAGYQLIDRIAGMLGGMREREVTSGLSASEIRELIGASRGVPADGIDPEVLLEEVSEVLIGHSLYNGHPKFLGYISSSPAPVGMLSDLLAAAVNSNVCAWKLAPVATEIEAQTLRWIAELLGFPPTCSGVLVSGGNMANFVGLYTALRAVFPRDDRERTPERLGRATIYASGETHTWIEKAIDLFGLPADALRIIGVDSSQRLELDELAAILESDVEEGRIPVAVIGSAGTVSTGAIDPLPAMAEICHRNSVWFHVDGAYGGFAAMIDSAPEDLLGLARADSLAVDPHKWLYTPLEVGCALIRDPEKHRAAYSYQPPYYHFGDEVTNFVDYGPQNSRGFRALKVWMGLRQLGRKEYERMIERDIELAGELYRLLDGSPEFEVSTLGLSIVTFRFVPEECRAVVGTPDVEETLNDLNTALQTRLESGGEMFVSNAVIDGRYLLRACIVNFRTSSQDIAEIPAIISRCGQEVWEERRLGDPAEGS